MNDKKVNYALKLLKDLYEIEKELDYFLSYNLDNEFSFILRNLTLIEMGINYLEYDLYKLKMRGDK